jgi:hypothetical protein
MLLFPPIHLHCPPRATQKTSRFHPAASAAFPSAENWSRLRSRRQFAGSVRLFPVNGCSAIRSQAVKARHKKDTSKDIKDTSVFYIFCLECPFSSACDGLAIASYKHDIHSDLSSYRSTIQSMETTPCGCRVISARAEEHRKELLPQAPAVKPIERYNDRKDTMIDQHTKRSIHHGPAHLRIWLDR